MTNLSIEENISNILNDFGLMLYCIETLNEHNENIFRINIYSKDKDISLKDCTIAHKAIYPILEDNIAIKHTVQVSSVGIEKPLLEHFHYQLAIGESIQVKVMNMKKIVGILKEVCDEHIKVLVDHELIQINLLDIKKAKTLFIDK